MRKVDVPARVRKAITLARRQAKRRGHTTGRAVYLQSLRHIGWEVDGEFAVGVRLGCTTCGLLMTLNECGLGPCRGHR
jgi:hypothetical protein